MNFNISLYQNILLLKYINIIANWVIILSINMPRKELNEATRDCTIHMGKAIHRIQLKKRTQRLLEKSISNRKETIDFDSNSLQTEKANAFSILRIFF